MLESDPLDKGHPLSAFQMGSRHRGVARRNPQLLSTSITSQGQPPIEFQKNILKLKSIARH